MKPYYQDQALTLYHGDALVCLGDLPSDSVDAVITDPPYNSGAATLTGKRAAASSKYLSSARAAIYHELLGDARDQRSFMRWSCLWLAECLRIARKFVPLLVFTDWRQLPCVVDAVQIAGWQWRGIVVWHKPSARPMLGEFKHSAEFIVYARKGGRGPSRDWSLPGIMKHNVNPAHKLHLTSKPIALMKELMPIVIDGGLVLDPFMGSGTTAVAARDTGRRCVGMELSRDYAQVIVDRMRSSDAETSPRTGAACD